MQTQQEISWISATGNFYFRKISKQLYPKELFLHFLTLRQIRSKPKRNNTLVRSNRRQNSWWITPKLSQIMLNIWCNYLSKRFLIHQFQIPIPIQCKWLYIWSKIICRILFPPQPITLIRPIIHNNPPSFVL